MIETGLFLPLRFYMNETEQDRYKRHAKGVALTEYNYLHASSKNLAPFQVRYVSDNHPVSIDLYIVCAYEHTAIKLPYNAACWELVLNVGGYYYLSYLGTDDFSGEFNNGLYYLRLDVDWGGGETARWYSDLFMVSDAVFEETEYRSHTELPTDLRAVDITDLRITK